MAGGDGMVVYTNTDMVKKASKGVMELIAAQPPAGLPDLRSGRGVRFAGSGHGVRFDRSRFYENKRAVPDKELGPLIKTSMNRCINCTRCVRFAEEVAVTKVLGQVYRGEEAEIGTFIDQLVKTELSGNLD
jgi:NADH-quinone oxidoreductase subunit G